jgi:hypothetical protein
MLRLTTFLQHHDDDDDDDDNDDDDHGPAALSCIENDLLQRIPKVAHPTQVECFILSWKQNVQMSTVALENEVTAPTMKWIN